MSRPRPESRTTDGDSGARSRISTTTAGQTSTSRITARTGFTNNHDGTFTDIAENAGVSSAPGAPGHLRRLRRRRTAGPLCHRLRAFRSRQPALRHTKAASNNTCEFRGVPVMCGPRGLESEPDHLFHNNGDGTFTDVSEKAGIADPLNHFYGLTPVFVDVNNDGKVDLAVANDSTLSYLFLNRGDGTFEDASLTSGFRAQRGRPRSGRDGRCRRRLPEQRPAGLCHQRLLRRVQAVVPQ